MRTLRGGELALEPQVAAHAPELFPLLSDESLYTFTDDKAPVSVDWLRSRFARLESRRSPDGSQHWLNWVVRDRGGMAVGYVQATVAGDGADIAYVIGRPHWRRGYALAASAAMISELAAAYGVRRVTATVDRRNTASLALLKKLGLGLVNEDAEANEMTFARDLP